MKNDTTREAQTEERNTKIVRETTWNKVTQERRRTRKQGH